MHRKPVKRPSLTDSTSDPTIACERVKQADDLTDGVALPIDDLWPESFSGVLHISRPADSGQEDPCILAIVAAFTPSPHMEGIASNRA